MEDTESIDGEKSSEEARAHGRSEPPPKPIPFLDTFYQLSSEESPRERSVAARHLIQHCLLSEQGVNTKDSAYALARLMKGLCTGRAASRQGFASCLSSFLKVMHSLDGTTIDAIVKEDGGDEHDEPAMAIRNKLLAITQYHQSAENEGGAGKSKKNRFGGKLKGIEERDHVFGRLFGILAVVRSGILTADDSSLSVIRGYTQDLIDLYDYKNWMREPAAHGIIELMSSLAAASQDAVAKVTNEVIIPSLLLSPPTDNENADLTDREQLLHVLTPEKIAVAVHLQTDNPKKTKFAYPLDEPLLTSESIPVLASPLSSTATVVYPRCHVVWNVIWTYLTEERDGTQEVRSGGEDSIEKIVQHVVVDRLLGKGTETGAPSDERRSLALQITSTLCGASDTKLVISAGLVDTVLCVDVVKSVFMNVLCASGGKGKAKAEVGKEHHLKPLTTQVLDDIITNCCESVDCERRLAFAKAFLNTDGRFDTKTKTYTVASILMLEGGDSDDEKTAAQRASLWGLYVSFLEERIVSAPDLHSSTVYIELLYKLGKRDLAFPSSNQARYVISFFLSGSLFDLSGLSISAGNVKKVSKKSKKKKSKVPTPPRVDPDKLKAGLRIKELLSTNEMSSIPAASRAIMTARFYSLLSDYISAKNAHTRGSGVKGGRSQLTYQTLAEVCGTILHLEESGAKPYIGEGVSADATKTSMDLVSKAREIADASSIDGLTGDQKLRAKTDFTSSCASLMMALSLQLMCRRDTGENESDDDDEDNDDEALHDFVSDLFDCIVGLCAVFDGSISSEDDEEKENPLSAISGLIVNILSSPVGGEISGKDQIQASASKLTRETVKLAWSGVLSAMSGICTSASSSNELVNEDFISILIESVCGENIDGGDDEESLDEVDESDDEELGDAFVDASNVGVDLDEVDLSSTNESQESQDEEEENEQEDIDIDQSKLEDMLLEDGDAEMGDDGLLEHHAGADKALAKLIKLKQEARKASRDERERVELANRLRCASLLDALFSASVLKSGWLPTEAVLGSLLPILKARKVLAKSAQVSTDANARKVASEKKALTDRLSSLIKDKLSKYRCTGEDVDLELVLKASSDLYDETMHSLNSAQCSCCSLALVTLVRCIPDVEDCDDVKKIYSDAVSNWSTQKSTKIHSLFFGDLIQRMPSLASCILIEPLTEATRNGISPYIKCESIKLLSAIYKHDVSSEEEHFSVSAKKNSCSKVVAVLNDSLSDSSLSKAKHRDEALQGCKTVLNYVKAHHPLTSEELTSLETNLKEILTTMKGGGMKQLVLKLIDTVKGLPRVDGQEAKQKAPKSTKERKKRKKNSKK